MCNLNSKYSQTSLNFQDRETQTEDFIVGCESSINKTTHTEKQQIDSSSIKKSERTLILNQNIYVKNFILLKLDPFFFKKFFKNLVIRATYFFFVYTFYFFIFTFCDLINENF